MKGKRKIDKNTKEHVLYLGDWFFHIGSVFMQTPFGMESKSHDMHFSGKRLVQALESEAELTCLASWELHRLPPGQFEVMLERSTVVIISDLEAKHFHLYPTFFERSPDQLVVPTYPDRLTTLKNWIAEGGGLMMLGGWLSFSGIQEKGGWRRSSLAHALPVECLIGDDRVDSSSGFTSEIVRPRHALVKNLPWDSFPPIFGYNELIPKKNAEVIVRVRETKHPLLVTGTYGKGRICVYASDPAPYWGINFEAWKGYDPFWQHVFKWVKKRDPAEK
jgi:uncharacterized membrane protein